MKRFWLTATAAIVVVVLGAGGEASAQSTAYPYYQTPTNPFPRPALSPYLNLLPANRSLAPRYLLGTLPEFDRRATGLQFRGALLELDRRTTTPLLEPSTLTGTILPETGHPVYYGNYGSYYTFSPLLRTGQAAGPTTPTAPTAPTAPTSRRPR